MNDANMEVIVNIFWVWGNNSDKLKGQSLKIQNAIIGKMSSKV